jgi:hypothetical protein
LDINSETTYSYHIINNINDFEYIIDLLDKLISNNIHILPFIFDYNFNINPIKWEQNGHIHQIFEDKYNKEIYDYKYIIYYIIKHFEIEKWPQPKIFFEYIYNNNLFYYIESIDKSSLKLCVNRVYYAFDFLDIYERDINLDHYILDIDEAELYIDNWFYKINQNI